MLGMDTVDKQSVEQESNGYTLDLRHRLEFEGHTLYRVRDNSGHLGGWVESLDNLGGYTRITGEAKVFGEARVINSIVSCDSIVCDKACVTDCDINGMVRIGGEAWITKSDILGTAQVSGSVKIMESSIVGEAVVTGKATIRNSHIHGSALVDGECNIENSWIWDHARVTGQADIRNVKVCDHANVGDNFSTPSIILEDTYKNPRDIFIAWGQNKDGDWCDYNYSRSKGCFSDGYTLQHWIDHAQTDSERAYREATAEYLTKIANLP